MFSEPDANKDHSCVFVIFGGTGDLTKRKLIPALYSLLNNSKLPDKFAIVSVGRREKTDDEYRKEMYSSVKEFSRLAVDEGTWNSFSRKIFYRQFDFSTDLQGYQELNAFLSNSDKHFGTEGNRLFYLAVAPELFEVIIKNLNSQGMLENVTSWQRVMVEKPFGSNLVTARALNQNISKILDEDNIFRIDHYLGKEMIQNILAIRFGNSVFEPLWNNNFIDNIQITSSEMLGVENRGGYYEGAGILKDMLQNHLLQMLTMVAMEPPVKLEPELVRNEKIKVLRSLRHFNKETAISDVVRGQYGAGVINCREVIGYRDEERVSKKSDADTFIALKVYVDNLRWEGVPFYIRSGKRLNRKTTEIIVQFKKLPGISLYDNFNETGPNLLVLQIQPREGFFFRINAKKPGSDFQMEQIQMDYCQSCRIDNNSPEAYERLILEGIRNNMSLFTRWDELEYSWQFIENIERAWQDNIPDFPNYAAGAAGPREAYELIARDGRHWWDSDTLYRL